VTPLVAVAKFLEGCTVYFFEGRVQIVIHDRGAGTPLASYERAGFATNGAGRR
jgi:hypothetical protein